MDAPVFFLFRTVVDITLFTSNVDIPNYKPLTNSGRDTQSAYPYLFPYTGAALRYKIVLRTAGYGNALTAIDTRRRPL